MNATETATQAAAGAEQGAHVAPKAAAATKAANQKEGAPKAKKRANKASPKKSSTTKTAVPREFSKKASVVDMLKARGGATVAAIAQETGWQNHTIRGFMAGAMKKAGYKIESTKNDAGERCYRIAK